MKFLLSNKYCLAFSVVCAFVLSFPLKAQTSGNFQVTAGLTTMWITNENAAVESIIPRNEDELPGAGFDGQQLGVSLRLLYGIDKANRFRINTGFDYYFLRGVQRNQLTSSSIYYTYGVDMPTFILGTEYGFVEYPPGNARIYAGIEARVVKTIAEPIDLRLVRLRDNVLVENKRGFVKENAYRIGGAVKLGIDGEILDPFYVNMSVGYGVVNLIGREDARGELFTPNHAPVYSETRESYIHNVLFSFLIQYRF
jgi:hypothetical protein